MMRKLRALTTVSALAAVLATGCSTDGKLPEPGSAAGEWCFAEPWIDQASYTFGYWSAQEDGIPGPDRAREAMGYGRRLMDQYQQDKQAGKLPSDLSDEELTAWVVNLATIQSHEPVGNQDEDSIGSAAMDSYIEEVHASCN